MLGLHGRGKHTLNTGVAPSAPPCSFCRHSQRIAECACGIRVGGCVGGQHRLSSTALRFSVTHNFFTYRRHLKPVNFEVRFEHEGNATVASADQRLPAPAPGGGELLPFATITVAPQSNVGPRMLTADVDSKPPKGVCLTTSFGISRSQ
jgi:hypothetical protein